MDTSYTGFGELGELLANNNLPIDYTGFVFLGAFALIGILFTFLRGSKSKRLIDEWASENGYQLLSAQRRTYRRGPFWLTTGRGQEVYYVSVIDSAGEPRQGWVRLGGMLTGLLSSRVDVRWVK